MFAASIQGEGVFTKKQFPKQPRYNAGLIPHERTYPWTWVLCAGPRFPLAFPSGSWAHAMKNGLLYLLNLVMSNLNQEYFCRILAHCGVLSYF